MNKSFKYMVVAATLTFFSLVFFQNCGQLTSLTNQSPVSLENIPPKLAEQVKEIAEEQVDPESAENVDDGPSYEPPPGELLFTGKLGAITPQHNATSECVTRDKSRPDAVNYDSRYYSGDYFMNSNPWKAYITTFDYKQCMKIANIPGWDFNYGEKDELTHGGKEWDVRSYPEIIYGVKRGDNDGAANGEYSHGDVLYMTKEKTGLPVRVASIPTIMIDLNYSSWNTGDYNVAIESFFHDSCVDIDRERKTSNMKYEIMLWLEVGEYAPAGKDGYVGDTTIDNLEVEIWTKGDVKDHNGFVTVDNKHYLAYLVKKHSRPITKRAINWSKFIDFAREEGHQLTTSKRVYNRPTDTHGGYNRRPLEDRLCLANILLGTEIWNGRGEFLLHKYDIRQYERNYTTK